VIDGTAIGEVAAGAMEYLEREYDAVDGAEVLDVVLVLAVRVPGDPGEVITHVEPGTGRDLPFYVAAGLLHAGLTALGMYEKSEGE
jgi:hypothetical protein